MLNKSRKTDFVYQENKSTILHHIYCGFYNDDLTVHMFGR